MDEDEMMRQAIEMSQNDEDVRVNTEKTL